MRTDYIVHKDWAESLGVEEKDFNYMIRGVAVKDEGHWSAYFHNNYDIDDGRCTAAANKFAPELMKFCKTEALEVFADTDPFTIHHNHNTHGDTSKEYTLEFQEPHHPHSSTN